MKLETIKQGEENAMLRIGQLAKLLIGVAYKAMHKHIAGDTKQLNELLSKQAPEECANIESTRMWAEWKAGKDIIPAMRIARTRGRMKDRIKDGESVFIGDPCRGKGGRRIGSRHFVYSTTNGYADTDENGEFVKVSAPEDRFSPALYGEVGEEIVAEVKHKSFNVEEHLPAVVSLLDTKWRKYLERRRTEDGGLVWSLKPESELGSNARRVRRELGEAILTAGRKHLGSTVYAS